MISYVVGRNFGHLSRCVPNVNYLRKKGKKVTVYSFGGVHRWLKSNFHNTKVKLRPCSKKKIETDYYRKLLLSDLIIHDWREELKAIKMSRFRRRPIICGIYHSDLKIRKTDQPRAKVFKREVLLKADKSTDIFFHMTLKQPDYIPRLQYTRYVPIPLIVRPVDQSPEKVKAKLGLEPYDRFILIQMGGGKGRLRYRFIHTWYKIIDQLKLDYKIVIASQIDSQNNYPFKNSRVVHAPLFSNGRDLIHAAEMVISKPGMGVLIDCIASKKPLLALPADTKERQVKNNMLLDLIGSDICLLEEQMSAYDLEKKIKKVERNQQLFQQAYDEIPTNGAEIIGKALVMLNKKKISDVRKLYPKLLELTPFRV